jgi:hypothetical protein
VQDSGNSLAVSNSKWQENPGFHWGKDGLNHHKRILTTTQETFIESEASKVSSARPKTVIFSPANSGTSGSKSGILDLILEKIHSFRSGTN